MTLAAEQSRATPASSGRLSRLYLARFVFAAAWAVAVAVIGDSLSAGTVTLLVVYPLVDVAAAVVDLRVTRNPTLWANIAVSALAVVGLAVTAGADITAVLRVWGVWAIVAGLVQLVVALGRRASGGQWPMTLAGGISLFAGAGFLTRAGNATSLTMIAGYAALGGLFFLAAAVRLRQRTRMRPERRTDDHR